MADATSTPSSGYMPLALRRHARAVATGQAMLDFIVARDAFARSLDALGYAENICDGLDVAVTTIFDAVDADSKRRMGAN